MRFKTDENLPVEVAAKLREAGYDAMTVGEQAMTGFPDDEVAQVVAALDLEAVDGNLWIADDRRLRIRSR